MLNDIITTINHHYVFQLDRKMVAFDSWRVMKLVNGAMIGDCDDYAITVLWHRCNKSFFSFVVNVLILHKFRIYFCQSSMGPHIIGYADGKYFDNWTKQPLDHDQFFEKTGHKHAWIVIGPIIAFNMLLGLMFR